MSFQLQVLKNLIRNKLAFYPDERKAFEEWQDKQVEKHLNKIVAKSRFYSDRQKEYGSWKNFPFINKQIMMDNFDSINTVGIKKDEALKLAIDSESSRNFSPTIGNITVGLSSGTSGNRGLFLVSPEERAGWVGYVMARVLWEHLGLKKKKIAFFLRANSNLYSSVKSRILDFNYFDMQKPVAENLTGLNQYQPDIIVGPPSMLRIIAEAQENNIISISPVKILSVAEVLEKIDHDYIGRVFNQVIHQAYQCTEGFLGVTCKYGTIHLNEDIVKIEKEYLDKDKKRFFPVITDFSRTSQPIIRYRLNDILVESSEPCSCGSVFTAIDHIEGRSDDIFYFKNISNRWIHIFPDFIRRAVITSSDKIQEFMVCQESRDQVNVFLKTQAQSFSEVRDKVVVSFDKLFAENRIIDVKLQFFDYIPAVRDKKLQRVKRNFALDKSEITINI